MELTQQNVAVVDDDPSVTDSLKMLLETMGCKVSVFSNGVQFLESDSQS